MGAKAVAVKKYVVNLSELERSQLDELIQKGKRSAQLLTKARILLKADVSDAGDGWSDSRIAEALDTSVEVIRVLDPRHPLYGRSFRVIRRSTHRGGNFPPSY